MREKPRLIILSDLFGQSGSNFVDVYKSILCNHFDIVFYDSCWLAQIDVTNDLKEARHSQFLNGGLETAVIELMKLERQSIAILAFSIGGVIAWKACLKGLSTNSLFCVSACRLRMETSKPLSPNINLYYGGQDVHRPSKKWHFDMNLECTLFQDGGHEFYKNNKIIPLICQDIIDSTYKGT